MKTWGQQTCAQWIQEPTWHIYNLSFHKCFKLTARSVTQDNVKSFLLSLFNSLWKNYSESTYSRPCSDAATVPYVITQKTVNMWISNVYLMMPSPSLSLPPQSHNQFFQPISPADHLQQLERYHLLPLVSGIIFTFECENYSSLVPILHLIYLMLLSDSGGLFFGGGVWGRCIHFFFNKQELPTPLKPQQGLV